MRLTALLASALSLTALLAGCFGGGGDGDGGPSSDDCDLEPALCDPDAYLASHHCLVHDVAPRVYAPDTPGPEDPTPDPWRQGDYWTYRLRVDGKDHGSVPLVYYDDADIVQGQAQHYLVGVADRGHALEHALYSINPMLGRIHRTLYSPHESGDHADMFNFPLCEGNTWRTRFYAADFTLTAHLAPDLSIPRGTDPLGFHIEGTASDGSRLTVEYSPTAKWFTKLSLTQPDGTDVQMDMTDYGSGKTGRYNFLRAQKDEAVDLGLQTADSVAIPREKGGEGAYDKVGFSLAMERTEGTGRVEVHLRDPAGNSRACVGVSGTGLGGQATACPAGPLLVETGWVEGEWSLTIERPLVGEVAIEGEARVVSIYDRGGTV